MSRADSLHALARMIAGVRRSHPLRVAIDGIDASGKTTLADELAHMLRSTGRPVIRASVDSFHRPGVERYARGRESPEGYYHDSFDYAAVIDELLTQLGPGGSLRYRTATFDSSTDSFIFEPLRSASPDSILLFDGVFLMKPELEEHWDFRVFVEVGFEEALRRGKIRDAAWMGPLEVIERRFTFRYLPGQRIYLDEVKPADKADVVVANDNVDDPRVIVNRSVN